MRQKFLSIFAAFLLFLFVPSLGEAQMISSEGMDGTSWLRSLETLRDLDYHSWQVVVYRQGNENDGLVLRVVGYPGNMRLNHPTNLLVHSGRREWSLEDITLSNTKLAMDTREAAAEFLLSPLIEDLKNNRPLRFELEGVFTELPIPPYLVSEWRSLLSNSLI